VDSSFARAFGGVAGSGNNPTDRGPPGVKHHALGDAHGIPLAGAITPEIKGLLPLVDRAGPLDQATDEPKQHPKTIHGDRAYASEPHRDRLRAWGIDPKLAKRFTEHGSGLGTSVGWSSGFTRGCTVSGSCGS
jgi:hypothetical protein